MISDIFRDPVWQFAGTVVSIAAILVSLWIAWTQRQKKRISYFPRSTQLLSVDTKIRDNIQILYEDRRTTGPFVLFHLVSAG
jgi:hypothetical protein